MILSFFEYNINKNLINTYDKNISILITFLRFSKQVIHVYGSVAAVTGFLLLLVQSVTGVVSYSNPGVYLVV